MSYADSETKHDIWYLKNIFSNEKDNILNFNEINDIKLKDNYSKLNKILEQFETKTIKISNIYGKKFYKELLDIID